MQDLIFQITGNQLFGVGSIIGIGLFIFLIRKYFSNVEKTSNQYYKKIEETLPNTPFYNSIAIKQPQKIILWNGDLASTYLLVDYLIQDKIIQPVYFEKYSIAKTVHKKAILAMANNDTNSNSNMKLETLDINNDVFNLVNSVSMTEISENDKKLFKHLAMLKKKEKQEKTRIEMLRNSIKRKYPEFAQNLLPTLYITNIAKDLDFTIDFFVKLRTIVNTRNIDYDGIEFIEQILRFFKHYDCFKRNAKGSNINIGETKIIAGYIKDKRIIEVIKSMIMAYRDMNNNTIISVPASDMSREDLKFMSRSVLDANFAF